MHLSTPLILSLTLLTTTITPALAGPYPRNAAHDYNGAGFLMPRQCDSYCGFGDAYCCSAGQVCTTNAANVAACVAPTAGAGSGGGGGGGGNDGSWNYYTTTIVDAVETTRVVTMSSFINAPAKSEPYIAQSTAVCYAPLISCGTICCSTGQKCYTSGQCRPDDGSGGGGGTLTGGPEPTAPVKGTSVIATTVPVTTTQGFVAPVETTDSSETVTTSKSKLSGGAIAGIVIGVIAGVIILLLLCACCCLSAGIKGVWHLIAGKKKDSRRDSDSRRHSGHYGGSAASRRETHGGWFGGAVPSKSGRGSRYDEKHNSHKKEAGLAGIGLALAALWAGMKFKKNKKEDRRRQSGSYYTSYTESYTGTTDSE
ncbi:hypothetical protein V493_05642 [Pseudogymnoascus sp. VKM F-4281 (FW-2241)]|nr:hypothetical protein V493_05642 [Pseudogymnoascus sp. VKM F-4281 (FW-2241)]